jgi:hypothetical protein
MWHIEFSSDKFQPYLPEEAQQNPGAYGFELADWISRQLAQRGLVASYPMGEDWGWFIEYADGEIEIMIGCGSEASEGDGYSGQPISWRVFVKQSRSLKQRFKGIAESPRVAEFAVAVEQALTQAGIHVTRTEA